MENQLEVEVKTLLSSSIDLGLLQQKINECSKQFSELDPQLVARLSTKLSKGLEYEQKCKQLLETLQESALTQENVQVIQDMKAKIQELRIDFPEFRKLVTVEMIPTWFKNLKALLIPKSIKINADNLTLSSLLELMNKQTDQLDPISMGQKLRNSLKSQVDPGAVPQVMDKKMKQLLWKLKTIIWIKDSFDLLGKEQVTMREIEALRSQQIPLENIERFKQLKYKYNNFKEHVNDMHETSASWIKGAEELLCNLEKSDQQLMQEDEQKSLKEITAYMQSITDKIEKIEEVKTTYYKLSHAMEWVQWVQDVKNMIMNGHKRSVNQLHILSKRASELKISADSELYKQFAEVYQVVQQIQCDYEEFAQVRERISLLQFNSTDAFYAVFEENKKKPPVERAYQLYQKMKQVQDKLNVGQDLAQFECDLKESDQIWVQTQKFYEDLRPALLARSIEKKDVEYLKLQLHNINKVIFRLPFYTAAKESELLAFEWELNSVAYLLGFEVGGYDEWGQLIACSKLLASPHQQILEDLGKEILLYQKIDGAIKELQLNEKMSYQERSADARKLRTLNELKALDAGIQQGLVKDEKQAAYVQGLLSQARQRAVLYNALCCKEQRSKLSEWRELLEKMRKNMPVACEEEFIVEEHIAEAEKILKMCKSNAKKSEIIQRYRLQKVLMGEVEELCDQFKAMEEEISQMEQKLFEGAGADLPYECVIRFQQRIDAVRKDFPKERIDRIENELFLKKIDLLQQLWKNKEHADNATFEKMQETFKEAYERFNDRKEDKYQKALQFLLSVCKQCEKRLAEVRKIDNLKKLACILKSEEGCRVGFVDLRPEIQTHRDTLEKQQKEMQELENKMNEDSSDEEAARGRAAKHSLKAQGSGSVGKRGAAAAPMVQKRIKKGDARTSPVASKCASLVEKKSALGAKQQKLLQKHQLQLKLKEQERKKEQLKAQIRNKMISRISEKLAKNAHMGLPAEACLQKAKFIVLHLTMSSKEDQGAMQKHYARISNFLSRATEYPHTSKEVAAKNATYRQVYKLSKLSEDDLERHESDLVEKDNQLAELRILNTIGKIKKKMKQPAGNELSPETAPSQAEKVEQRLTPQEEKGECGQELDTQAMLKMQLINKNALKQFQKQKMSVAKSEHQTGRSQSASQTLKSGGCRFSDDEEPARATENEVVYFNDEDIPELKQLQQQEMERQMKTYDRIPILFDPDCGGSSSRPEASLSVAGAPQMAARAQSDQPPCVSILLENMFVAEEATFSRIQLLSMEHSALLAQLPCHEGSLQINGKIPMEKVEEYIVTVQQQRRTQHKRIMLVGGWFQAADDQEHALLSQFAEFLLARERVGVVEWSQECKMYVMHKNMVSNEWKSHANFRISSRKTITLQFLAIFKQYKMAEQAYDKLSVKPFFFAHLQPAHRRATQALQQGPAPRLPFRDQEKKNADDSGDADAPNILQKLSNPHLALPQQPWTDA